jgi:hypothetical protein
LEAASTDVEWAGTRDAVHVEFYVDQTWSAKEPFFTEIGQGETHMAAFAAAVGATRLRFSIARCSLMFRSVCGVSERERERERMWVESVRLYNLGAVLA